MRSNALDDRATGVRARVRRAQRPDDEAERPLEQVAPRLAEGVGGEERAEHDLDVAVGFEKRIAATAFTGSSGAGSAMKRRQSFSARCRAVAG